MERINPRTEHFVYNNERELFQEQCNQKTDEAK